LVKKKILKIRLEGGEGADINGLYIIARHDIMLTNIRLFGQVTDEKSAEPSLNGPTICDVKSITRYQLFTFLFLH
jgi:hypothetical protein